MNARLLRACNRISDTIIIPRAKTAWAREAKKLALPMHFVAALLSVEDKRFIYHPGVDPLAIVRALMDSIARRRLKHGASTITQQLYSIRRRTKRGHSGRFGEKLRQALWAIGHTATTSKSAILAEYLETVYWGRDYYGLEEAATGYFKVRPNNLSAAESFFLVERLASPNRVSPERVIVLLCRPAMYQCCCESKWTLDDIFATYEHFFVCGAAIKKASSRTGKDRRTTTADSMELMKGRSQEIIERLEIPLGQWMPMLAVPAMTRLTHS